MTNIDEYHLVPLSIQPQGKEYLVGNTELDEFYQLPVEGVRVIEGLREGHSLIQIKQTCLDEFAEDIDVGSFVEFLLEVEFLHKNKTDAESAIAAHSKLSAETDKRWVFQMSAKGASLFFSWPAVLIYCLVITCAAYLYVTEPQARINLSALYITENFTLFFLSLLFLFAVVSMMHECGHMIAGARLGLEPKLGIGNRLWIIVAECDLSGIYGKPKSQRYLPLMAGMLVDLFSVSSIVIILAILSSYGVQGVWVQILQALTLQILITITWQFNIFLRTDVYYILSNYTDNPNLDQQARTYLSACLFRLSLGRVGAPLPSAIDKRQLKTMRLFSTIWLLGRIAAMIFLVLIIVPALTQYARDAWQAVGDGAQVPFWTKVDLIAFFLCSLLVFGGGMLLWLRGRFNFLKRNRNVTT
ncbi:hypothetical protein Sden_2265 [Shewanella denitrificans OS217]|uniref:Peptidase M50 n=1 Tax=Shewanella denitrificans (strain OS217 / ATCC BAA-1090 / DSM 15013) TaxID=318161 RepID=Q12LY1_SHEDO|nr:hypothetical protein [Shewanella denitrificans]ABE55545.1 hypothetical protein Sden_2265 [Shewanella denitrificans OS217]